MTRRLSSRCPREAGDDTGPREAANETGPLEAGDGTGPREAGNAAIEFVFVALLILVPIAYFAVAVAAVQRSTVGVAQAAREAGRAYATGESSADALARANAAVRLALADEGLPDDAQLRFVSADASCQSSAITPELAPGAVFAVCVVRHARLPAVPSLIAGGGITTVGRYVIHVDDFRTVQPS